LLAGLRSSVLAELSSHAAARSYVPDFDAADQLAASLGRIASDGRLILRLESRKKALERVQKVNDMILAVLKNHIVVEQFMNDFLEVSGRKHRRLTFDKKSKRCQAQKPAEINPPIWKVLEAGNDLRNKIAHTLDQSEIQPKMDALRAAFLAALTPERAKEMKDLDDVRIAGEAFQLCDAYLVAAALAVQARQAASS
jgi:hypothetical protein